MANFSLFFLFTSLLYLIVWVGKPPPLVLWFQDDQIIDDDYEIAQNTSQVENVLIIEKLERKHLSVSYSCKAINDFFYKSLESSITLELNCESVISLFQDQLYLIIYHFITCHSFISAASFYRANQTQRAINFGPKNGVYLYHFWITSAAFNHLVYEFQATLLLKVSFKVTTLTSTSVFFC